MTLSWLDDANDKRLLLPRPHCLVTEDSGWRRKALSLGESQSWLSPNLVIVTEALTSPNWLGSVWWHYLRDAPPPPGVTATNTHIGWTLQWRIAKDKKPFSNVCLGHFKPEGCVTLWPEGTLAKWKSLFKAEHTRRKNDALEDYRYIKIDWSWLLQLLTDSIQHMGHNT